VILKGFDYTFKKGERIGIIGKNGSGKSTFLKILQGIVSPDSGKINIGDTVLFGNFSQDGLEIKEDMRIIEFVKNIAENFPLADGGTMSASQFLSLFLFPPEQQYTFLSKLSGGEKKRLQLLSILFRNPNFIILDEPTNDLDLPTLSVLEEFLNDYQGCLIIVSHDRYFMDRMVNHLFVFESNGVIRDFPGNYSEYRLISRDREEKKNEEEIKPEAGSNFKNEIPNSKSLKKKLSFKEKREFEHIEKDIALLGKEKIDITDKMSAPDLSYDNLQSLSARLITIAQQLEAKELRWLELSEYDS
jgi:ATP-binding cassette subfamily F protein uup